MKYVAIATISKSYLLKNYGSFFQHYALRKVLKDFGLHPFRVQATNERNSKIQKFIDLIKDFLRPYYWALKRLPQRHFYVVRMRKNKNQELLFLADYKKLIGMIDEPMVFGESTIGIKGGDQIFSAGEKRMWLHDIKEGNLIISYAASGDWRSILEVEETQEMLKTELVRFTAIGVREQCGVDLISKILSYSKPVKHVVDPVFFLREEYLKLIQSRNLIFKKPTLFCYFVNIRNYEELQLDKYVALAKCLDCELKMLGIQGAEFFIPDEVSVSLKPTEFLRGIHDSKYFITNSFHGSVFGLIYGKNFLSVTQNDLPGADQNQRQKELMQRYGLENRWVHNTSTIEEMEICIQSDINWSKIEQKISSDCAVSITWLKDALMLNSNF
jgi:hypothetical protein